VGQVTGTLQCDERLRVLFCQRRESGLYRFAISATGETGQSRRKTRILKFAGNGLANLLYRFTGFPARLADFLLDFTCYALSVAFGFEVGIADQFSGIVLDSSLDLFAFAFDLSFVPHHLSPFSLRIFAYGSGYFMAMKTFQSSARLK
jgi:hypothetical protein